jgi:phospholipid transport system substrate-binding protein
MTPLRIAAALALAAPLAAPVYAQDAAPAATGEAAQAQQWIQGLSQQAFAILRDKSMSRAAARTKFRAMLEKNVALSDIGDRLIRRQRPQITPAQYSAYQAALPEFVLNAYSDRLYNYANADVRFIRTVPRSAGAYDVFSRVAQPGAQPFDTIWRVKKGADGQFKIDNLTVAGINLALTQEADFTAYIQRNGFDKLVEFMKSANAKAAV